MVEDKIDPIVLMGKYIQQKDIETRNQLLLHYSYIARAVAVHMRDIYQNYAQTEDIVNQGIITLIECIERYDPEKGVKFESYAFMRVKGSVIDFIRKQDWLPRRVRKTAKDIEKARIEISNKLFREPNTSEIAQYMNISYDELNKHYSEITNSVMLSFEGVVQNALEQDYSIGINNNEDNQPESNILKLEVHQTLVKHIDKLRERERIVISLYYYENLKFYEIAQVLEVSEARVCQIHSKAVIKLKAAMDTYMKG